ncbi:MAG: tRNA (N(6)-L-threonylcarbamoyladenosine(37)-C(2))-methylthiotransferase [Candidatus Micrarchaeia archaeon]
MAKILIETYGCTLNQADSEVMASLLSSSGHEVSTEPGYASSYDIVILNTCTVKTPTEQKILDRVKKLSQLGTRLIVAGCLATASPEKILALAPKASILSLQNVDLINEVVSAAVSGKSVRIDERRRLDKLQFFQPNGSVIAKIPIGEGCLGNCTFCETKFARGPLNSFSPELVLRAVKLSVEKGAKEIELTSQDTGAYGVDRKTDLVHLLESIVQLDGDFKLRLGMLNPEHLARLIDGLVEVYRSNKMYKFIHIPVQSGSDSVLKAMRRSYSVDEFLAYVKELRNKVNGISIETDIIVGFPTETRSDFEKTLELLNEARPEVTNVSKFGARPHAEASKLKQLDNIEIKKRSIEASRLVRSIQYESRREHVGELQEVLVTEQNSSSSVGRNSSYLSVAFPGKRLGLGIMAMARITSNTYSTLLAEPAL